MASSATLRHINQARVLDALREQGTLTRVELATMLGLQRSTITVITGALIEEGLVHELAETSAPNRGAGRPAVGLALSGPGAYFAGLDLGNELSTAIVVDLTGAEVGRASTPTDASHGPEAAEDILVELLRDAIGNDPHVAARLQGHRHHHPRRRHRGDHRMGSHPRMAQRPLRTPRECRLRRPRLRRQ